NEEQVEHSQEPQKLHIVEILDFLFQLSSLEMGQAYLVESLTHAQRQMLADLREFGLTFQQRGSNKFYPTRLVTVLSSLHSGSGATPLSNVGIGATSLDVDATQLPTSTGFIILETNYMRHHWSGTSVIDSPLQTSILSLFVEMHSRFPNLITGRITRDSVRRAFNNGITAEQIIMYMMAHAHPQLRSKTPVLPITVTDQIRLWEQEKERINMTPGFMYSSFNKMSDFETV
ncbi:RNA polymerase II transcription factor B 52 kDa subunit, partial [Spiromyces aspiralis]